MSIPPPPDSDGSLEGYAALRFIGEQIQVEFNRPPALEKVPGCPDRFIWRGQHCRVVRLIAEWHDHSRRGRMARSMQPQHAEAAAHRGSWGVGRSYFRIESEAGQVFDLYYDRAPDRPDQRRGSWYLYRELTEVANG